MPEIMPSEARNVRPPQQLRPRRLESGLYSKDMLTAARLFAPASEHAHSLLIQSDVTCLATLRVPAFDREELMVEVEGSPAQFEKFTAAKSGVHGKEHGGRQVIPEV
jgi:hypothetical protein